MKKAKAGRVVVCKEGVLPSAQPCYGLTCAEVAGGIWLACGGLEEH